MAVRSDTRLKCIFQSSRIQPSGGFGSQCKAGGGCTFGRDIKNPAVLGDVIRAVTDRSVALRRAGIRTTKFVNYISKTGAVPTRREIGAEDYEGIEGSFCAALIPEAPVQGRYETRF